VKNLIAFQNTYASLPENFYQKIHPTPVPHPQLILWNQSLADDLNIPLNTIQHTHEIEQIFSGNCIQNSSIPLATVYSGHQFGHFSPVLGDGRAHLLGEITANDHRLYDLQLKGSGQTKYSRRGDGKSALGPALREWIVSEFMHTIGIPTTRSLAVLATGETVQRETRLPGGIVTRVAPSFIRVGTFEYFASLQAHSSLQQLFDYTVDRLFPELRIRHTHDLPIAFFNHVTQLQAQLVAQWLSVGFIHGVMNTDNTSIAGITLDYGPCAFLDETNFNKVFSSIDRHGRYAYSNQPSILQWNLIKLAEALFPLFDLNPKDFESVITKSLHVFSTTYQKHWQHLMLNKLGIVNHCEPNSATNSEPPTEVLQLLDQWHLYLQQHELDFTLAHYHLKKLLQQPNPMEPSRDVRLLECPDFNAEPFLSFKIKWLKHVQPTRDESLQLLEKSNPLYIPRNHLIEKIIHSVEQGDTSELHTWIKILQDPYTEHADSEHFYRAPETHERVSATFCGT
jgi:uncharacterized protein YdiU (UPF0061 family)